MMQGERLKKSDVQGPKAKVRGRGAKGMFFENLNALLVRRPKFEAQSLMNRKPGVGCVKIVDNANGMEKIKVN